MALNKNIEVVYPDPVDPDSGWMNIDGNWRQIPMEATSTTTTSKNGKPTLRVWAGQPKREFKMTKPTAPEWVHATFDVSDHDREV